MFDTEHIACYLDGLTPRVMKDKTGDEIKVWDLTWRIEPITPILAAEIGDEVKGTLFRRNDAERNPHIKAVVFNTKPRPQEIVFRPDPVIPEASLVLEECKLSKLTARQPKDGTHWVFTFRATTAHLTGAQLLYLQEALYRQHFLTFGNAAPGLFDDDEKKARRARRQAAGGSSESTTAH